MSIELWVTDHSNLSLIQPLWERLRDHHAAVSGHFAEQIRKNTFESRSEELLSKAAQGRLHLVLARDALSGELAGYCVSTVTATAGYVGEIDSIYIRDEYRGQGAGDALMRQTLGWLRELRADPIRISVLFGNEGAIRFYERYGFYPRAYVLQNKA